MSFFDWITWWWCILTVFLCVFVFSRGFAAPARLPFLKACSLCPPWMETCMPLAKSPAPSNGLWKKVRGDGRCQVKVFVCSSPCYSDHVLNWLSTGCLMENAGSLVLLFQASLEYRNGALDPKELSKLKVTIYRISQSAFWLSFSESFLKTKPVHTWTFSCNIISITPRIIWSSQSN